MLQTQEASCAKERSVSSGVPTISKWDPAAAEEVELLRLDGTRTNNTTKGNPVLQADLFGDWREELALRLEDGSGIRIFTTTDVTDTRIPTLMHDSQYRVAVAGQNSAYNQPPHPSYFLGEGMAEPPVPARMPTVPPIMLSVTASTRNCRRTSPSVAPTAMRTPISRVRSVTDTSIMFIIPMPPTTSDTAATEPSRIVITRLV